MQLVAAVAAGAAVCSCYLNFEIVVKQPGRYISRVYCVQGECTRRHVKCIHVKYRGIAPVETYVQFVCNSGSSTGSGSSNTFSFFARSLCCCIRHACHNIR
jgi:hypothetical protein